jgi:hypothetical protein
MSEAENKPPGDYEVGYGKPPKSGQFKKGQSGCPSGGKKKPPTLHELLAAELDQIVSVKTAGGKIIKMTKAQAMAKRIVRDALDGDHKAQTLALKILADAKAANDDAVSDGLSDADLKQLLLLVEPPDED